MKTNDIGVLEFIKMTFEVLKIFENRPEEPLLFVECGSRLWGVNREDSDYDIRGFYIEPKSILFDYDYKTPAIKKLQGEIDFVGYHIDQFFKGLEKSNPNYIDMLCSDIIYFNALDLSRYDYFRTNVLNNINYYTMFMHHYNLATKELNKFLIEASTFKKLFIVFRSYLIAHFATIGLLPEMQYSKLISQYDGESDFAKVFNSFIELQKVVPANYTFTERDLDLIVKVVIPFANNVYDKRPRLDLGVSPRLRNILKEYIIDFKTDFYSYPTNCR